jgi:hypothetical protein
MVGQIRECSGQPGVLESTGFVVRSPVGSRRVA